MSIRNYILKELANWIASDEQILNKFFRYKKYTYPASAIIKLWSSINRKIKHLAQKWIITEIKTMRIEREWYKNLHHSSEIFYKLNK